MTQLTGLLGISQGTLVVFLLVLARTTSWAATAPLFGARGVPPVARLAVGIALALFFTPLAAVPDPPQGVLDVVALLAAQSLFGLALGWLTGLWLTAVEMAGALVDFQSGFSMGALVDPVSGAQSAAFARLANVSVVALLFATGGYGAVLDGFGRSFMAVPVDVMPHVAAGAALTVAHAVTGTMVAAVEIAAPLLGVLFLTEIVLAVAARLTPQANPQAYGLSVKGLVALGTGGTLLAVLPTKAAALLAPAVHLGGQVLR
jgi:flagellar biosynthetic protein FliR